MTKFKCATIAEAEMIAQTGAPDVLLAYPLVGPNIDRFLALIEAYPATRFSALFDDQIAVETLAARARVRGLVAGVWLDIDLGQHRTGVEGGAAVELYRFASGLPGIRVDGLHGYDGQNHQPDLAARTTAAAQAQTQIDTLAAALKSRGLAVPGVVLGGTPTFPQFLKTGSAQISPGTCFLHDHGYTAAFPDLAFEAAALVLTRVISVHPAQGTFTLDLGHKAVAADPPGLRGILFGQARDFAAPCFKTRSIGLEARVGNPPGGRGRVLRSADAHLPDGEPSRGGPCDRRVGHLDQRLAGCRQEPDADDLRGVTAFRGASNTCPTEWAASFSSCSECRS